MTIEHIVIHTGAVYHCAFPDIIRLQNGDLLTVSREAPAREGSGVPGEPDGRYTHGHLDAESRIAMVLSADDGRTWYPASRVVIDASDGTQGCLPLKAFDGGLDVYSPVEVGYDLDVRGKRGPGLVQFFHHRVGYAYGVGPRLLEHADGQTELAVGAGVRGPGGGRRR